MSDGQESRTSEEDTISNQDSIESQVDSLNSSPPSTSNEDTNQGHDESVWSCPPPTSRELDFQRHHISLKRFGEGLQLAAKAMFPNDSTSRYTKTSVLILSWQDEDPNLPVSIEISRLSDVFEHVYKFEVESWQIPAKHSHFELNQKIGAFVRPEGDDRQHLKIVYYAGHARLAKNRTLVWAGWSKVKGTPPPTLTWSGIQALLEQAQNDVLILLDCCCSGIANTGEGNGVTELIAACGYNNEALGVGPYSFSSALIMELHKLSKRSFFSVGELYSNIYLNIQHRTLMDGTERHPPPIHLPLTQEAQFPRSIQLTPFRELSRTVASIDEPGSSPDFQAAHSVAPGSTPSNLDEIRCHSTPFIPETDGLNNSSSELVRGSQHLKVPRMSFAIRLKDTFRPDELCEDLFREWLRLVPAVVEEVKIEAGFGSFSSLLIVSVPIAFSIYIPRDPAVISLGPITTSNMISSPGSHGNPKLAILEEKRTLSANGDTTSLLALANVTLGSCMPQERQGSSDQHRLDLLGKLDTNLQVEPFASFSQTITHCALKGHTDSVSAVVFSPDSKLVASASYDKTVKLWDPATGKSHGTFNGHMYLVSAIAFSPDGKAIASASYDKTIKLWCLATGATYLTLEGHTDWVTAIAFSPDGNLLVSGSYDKTIRIWNPASGTTYHTLTGHSYLVSAIAFSPDGRFVASASYDKTIKIWGPATGILQRTLEGHKYWVTAVAVSPNGKLIASASYDKTVRLWDSDTGLPATRRTLKGHTDWVTAVVFSPDGQVVVSASYDKTIRIWDPATGLTAGNQTLKGNMGSILSLAFSPDGKFVASGSHDKMVRLWDGLPLTICSPPDKPS